MPGSSARPRPQRRWPTRTWSRSTTWARFGDGSFLAMELVDGGTLRQWWRAEARSIREIVTMFVQVGRGLHAAHEHGIVHRDFKPGNVLVGTDGRPRIADFGLAAPVDGWSLRDAARAAKSGGVSGGSATLRSTDGDTLYGTPAYMSPEQYRGTGVTPHADQFAFAVALFEAAYGQRPFVGPTASALADAVLCHRVTIPKAARKRVPKVLAQIIAKGMAHRAEDRYPDVATMVRALERFLRRRRWWITGVAAVGVAAAGLGVGHRVAVASGDDPCGAVVDSIEHVAIDLPDMREELDAYAVQWRDRRLAACTATRVDAAQSEYALQLQFACLDRAAVSLSALSRELASTTGKVDEKGALRILVPLAECDDLDALAKLGDGLQGGGDAGSLQTRREAWDAVATARTRLLVGKDGWAEDARTALTLAAEHDLPRVEAWSHLLLGIDAHRSGAPDESASAYDRAVRHALAAGDQTLAVNAILRRAEIALELGRPEEAELHLGYARASLPAVLAPEHADYLAREIGKQDGRNALVVGDYGRAVARLQGAVDDAEKEPWGDDPQAQGQLGILYGELGNAHKGAGDPERSIAATERALELFTTLPGVHRGLLATTHGNLVVSYIEVGRFADADEHLARARGALRRDRSPRRRHRQPRNQRRLARARARPLPRGDPAPGAGHRPLRAGLPQGPPRAGLPTPRARPHRPRARELRRGSDPRW